MECRRLLPPYFKYAIFFFCGMELVFSALLMAINQKFWDLSEKIFPTAYRIFDDTLLKGEPEDFTWGATQLSQLNMYQEKLKYMWFSSTLVVLFTMLCIVPQFCTTEESSGEEVTYCIKKPKIGFILAPILLALVLLMAAILTWQWATCDSDFKLFQTLFRQSQKEESFLSELEHKLNCILDDDKEVDGNWECDNTIDRSILNSKWLNPLFYGFFLIHAFMILGFSLINKDFSSRKPSLANAHSHHHNHYHIRRAEPAELDSNGSEALILHPAGSANNTPFKYALHRSSTPSSTHYDCPPTGELRDGFDSVSAVA